MMANFEKTRFSLPFFSQASPLAAPSGAAGAALLSKMLETKAEMSVFI